MPKRDMLGGNMALQNISKHELYLTQKYGWNQFLEFVKLICNI